ncbi:MAG: protein kinase [Acidobacteria bacterium]|nr:protein kinase [Acidobacteriota bacterium]
MQHAADAVRKARLAQEARAASALHHPNIGADYIVMEYIEGKTFDAVIFRDGLRTPETLRYATQIASALTAAHEAGMTHRDIKPGNIMITEEGMVKVLDFGLEKLREDAPPSHDDATRVNRPKTEQGAILGTVAYMRAERSTSLTHSRSSSRPTRAIHARTGQGCSLAQRRRPCSGWSGDRRFVTRSRGWRHL